MERAASPRAGTPARAGLMTPSAAPDPDVEAFLSSLEHPRRGEILALRRIVLEAHPSISEGIKWNAPSFRTTEYFATFHLRAKRGVQIILHRGAKKRADAVERGRIADGDALLEWRGDDRAAVTFADMDEVRGREAAFSLLIRQWIEHV